MVQWLGAGGATQVALEVKNLPLMQEVQETRVQSLDGEDLLEKEKATHSSILAAAAATAAKSLQSCPTLCDSIDGSLLFQNELRLCSSKSVLRKLFNIQFSSVKWPCRIVVRM